MYNIFINYFNTHFILLSSWYFSFQVRTSYLPNEILWGYRFEHSCVSYDKQEAKYAVSNNLNKSLPDNTPRCSPKDWLEKINKAAASKAVSSSLSLLVEGEDKWSKLKCFKTKIWTLL